MRAGTEGASQSNRVSRARTGVGRAFGGTSSRRPRRLPPAIRTRPRCLLAGMAREYHSRARPLLKQRRRQDRQQVHDSPSGSNHALPWRRGSVVGGQPLRRAGRIHLSDGTFGRRQDHADQAAGGHRAAHQGPGVRVGPQCGTAEAAGRLQSSAPIGIVYQNNLLLEDRSAYDNVALPLHISGLGPREVRRRTEAALDSVGLLKSARRFPRLLSQGEQQRLGIARAVVNRPELLVADEPTGNLDPELSREVMKLFRRLVGYGVTALVATHDVGLIESLPARRISLLKGRVDSDTSSS